MYIPSYSDIFPADSHLKHYYDDVFEYLNIGPSVNFIFRYVNPINREIISDQHYVLKFHISRNIKSKCYIKLSIFY